MSVRPFGRSGRDEIVEVTLAAGDLEVRVITWGAVLRDLVVRGPAGPRRVVLGLERLEDYIGSSSNLGAVVGRYANRIGHARFRLGGDEVALVANENRNELHGGPDGFGRRAWTLVSHDAARAHLALVSEDGDMGYPGRLHAFASYEIAGPSTLRIALQAFADEPTPVNLTSHGYFNLDGSPDVRDHRLALVADHVLPTDREMIPTGEIASVGGTPFDFREARPIRAAGLDLDVPTVLRRDRSPSPVLARAATLSSPVSGLAMELWTTETCLQVYDGHKLDGSLVGLGGRRYGRYAGVALEPQRFPDAPNHAHFPPCTLRAGEVSRQITELRFATGLA